MNLLLLVESDLGRDRHLALAFAVLVDSDFDQRERVVD
jgi:hypothetical protein